METPTPKAPEVKEETVPILEEVAQSYRVEEHGDNGVSIHPTIRFPQIKDKGWKVIIDTGGYRPDEYDFTDEFTYISGGDAITKYVKIKNGDQEVYLYQSEAYMLQELQRRVGEPEAKEVLPELTELERLFLKCIDKNPKVVEKEMLENPDLIKTMNEKIVHSFEEDNLFGKDFHNKLFTNILRKLQEQGALMSFEVFRVMYNEINSLPSYEGIPFNNFIVDSYINAALERHTLTTQNFSHFFEGVHLIMQHLEDLKNTRIAKNKDEVYEVLFSLNREPNQNVMTLMEYLLRAPEKEDSQAEVEKDVLGGIEGYVRLIDFILTNTNFSHDFIILGLFAKNELNKHPPKTYSDIQSTIREVMSYTANEGDILRSILSDPLYRKDGEYFNFDISKRLFPNDAQYKEKGRILSQAMQNTNLKYSDAEIETLFQTLQKYDAPDLSRFFHYIENPIPIEELKSYIIDKSLNPEVPPYYKEQYKYPEMAYSILFFNSSPFGENATNYHLERIGK